MTFLTNEPRKIDLPAKPKKGLASWKAPSNIALVKYWGKFGEQLPMNPSLSFTLKKSYTETKVEYAYSSKKVRSVELFFENKKNVPFGEKIDLIIKERLLQYLPWLEYTQLKITSFNTFPHSAGIASSASSMSALALCLLSIEEELLKKTFQKKVFYRNASFIARLLSGSACRSVFGGYNLWGTIEDIIDTSDAYAIPVNEGNNEIFQTIHDAILIVSSGTKPVSSSLGHSMMDHHPFASGRYQQSRENLLTLIKTMQNGQKDQFLQIVENEALSLHALMLSSKPGYILLKPESLQIIEKIYKFRHQEGINIGFTIDAGPNIHLLYFDEDKKQVKKFIKDELIEFCENQHWIDDKIGPGPQKIKPE